MEELRTVQVDALPPFEDIDDGSLFSISLSSNTAEFTHGMHRFPAKFIPQIPGWALDQFSHPKARILDPFSGSGTTLVESLLRGGTAVGLDVDPLARLIARAKTSHYSASRLLEMKEYLRRDNRRRTAPVMNGVDNFQHWFSAPARRSLSSLLRGILELPADPAERDFFLTVFSSILRITSNADDQSHKTYVSHTRPKHPLDVTAAFDRSFSRAIQGIIDLQQKRAIGSNAYVLEDGDALSIPLIDASVDLIVTSPPYLDSVDYMYNFMLEYFWLGACLGVQNRTDFNQRRRSFVGAKNPIAAPGKLPPAIESLLGTLLRNSQRWKAATGYFDRMNAHFQEAARCARIGSRYVLVIGNSQTRGDSLPVHEGLVRLAEGSGWQLEKYFGYRVRRHYMKFPRMGRGGVILIDWVLVFKRTDRAIHPRRSIRSVSAFIDPGAVAN